MDRIRDLTETGGRGDELLTSTSSSGFREKQYLSGEPPVSYLKDYEEPQYVLRNKKAGVKIADGPSLSTTTPDDDHQALAVVTDCRILFIVGRAQGDEVETVRHDTIVEAATEDGGLMKSTMVIETVEDGGYRFTCRGDVSEVVDYVEDASQTWANASRLTDEASKHLESGRDLLEKKEFEPAREVLSDVASKVDTASGRVSTVGGGAEQELEERASQLIDRLHQLEQEIAAMEGAYHHRRAQQAWKTDHDFDTAAREYEQAAEGYERALAANGTEPSDEALQLRLKGVLKERVILRAAPMADARAAREVAIATDDPDEAAAEWETALTCYREAVTLDWGESDREFIVKRDLAQERAVEATDEALDAHLEAGEEWTSAGDKIVRNGKRKEARQAYDRAQDHFETAHEIARELRPERDEKIRERLEEVERRRAGEVMPPAQTEDKTLSVEAVADQLEDTGEERRESTAAIGGDGVAEAETVVGASDESLTRPETGVEPTGNRESADDEATSPEETVTERETRIQFDTEPSEGTGGASDDTTADGPEPPSEEELAELTSGLRVLSESEMTELVADVWDAKGWSTTVFSATTKAVYDVVAMRGDGGEEQRLLLWTVHRSDGGTIGATVVRRCATTRDSSEGADAATLVTTGTLTNAARERADELDVTVVDCEAFAEAVHQTGLGDRL